MDNIIALATVGIIVFVVCIVAVVMACINRDQVDNMDNHFITRLENTDHSIQDAVKYLKRTNGLGTNFRESN